MPIGSYSSFADIICDLIHHRPNTILDLGIGFGMNGAGIRNWLDSGVKPWNIRLVGVEGWADYISPCWDCYDKVHVCTIQDYLKSTDQKFDAIVMTDVIEHFDKEEGQAVLAMCMAHLNPGGALYVSTPGIFFEQGAAHGNELERHRSEWKVAEFAPCHVIRAGTELDHYGHQMIVVKKTNL